MRRGIRNRQEEDAKIDITPMLDVVFIMLIFFIVTASFIKQSGATITKPEAVNAVKHPKASILLAIDENNDIWLDKRVIDPRAIKANIARMRAETPDGEVIVQADIESNAETLMKVVDALKEAGIPLPTVSTKSE
ncbi:biopolymer transporter ExbD [Arenicella chitinivorans]|jgi:biopolymer transport protein ExbD|uniref:Biopolymer transporter ExbD n=1 Tax=Arenicella chitinivorans TaxID=1329800 RepID=A0A918VNE2_9GAMM|nr:biopolymer transporter ExbD [Arenicella chitinivorans]GHA12340.1 biopolymer transporter ExbD [Arenicella chitinivorans]